MGITRRSTSVNVVSLCYWISSLAFFTGATINLTREILRREPKFDQPIRPPAWTIDLSGANHPRVIVLEVPLDEAR